tara:strand:- start:217 stop:1266 length:1050 start_codon:yes stop_codon:yes gene_type:complete
MGGEDSPERGADSDARSSDRASNASPGGGGRAAEAGGGGGGGGEALLPGTPRTELHAGARWLEDALPFVLLLLLVFLQQHLLGIVAFCWLSTVLHNANIRMRRQVMLKEARELGALVLLALLLVSQVAMVLLLGRADALGQQLLLRAMAGSPAEAELGVFDVLWSVLVCDLMVRYGLMLLKVCLTVLVPPSAFRRLRRSFALVEAAGLCYRSLLPMPAWYSWLLRTVQGRLSGSLLAGSYLTFKLAQLVERGRVAASIGRSLLLHQLHFGKYATQEELLEAGDDQCAICQEQMLRPVLLDECSHIFCEECILSWSERAADATCPLCRAPIASAIGSHTDGSTTLLPQLF